MTPATPGAPGRSQRKVSLLSFDPFSLDIFYYPVSWIMLVWYKLFAFALGPTNFFAWALSVMFLVFTLRAILYKPFVRQIRTTRQMQELQPQIKALQKKYGKDRQRMALEMQKLQREHGFNPILGCLPMLAQIPVFLGLYHVLRSFNRTTGGFGQPHMSVAQNRMTGNYVFTPADVGHFLDANLWGAPIGAFMTQHAGLDAFTYFSRPAVIAVGTPVMVLAGIATYFNSRASVARQSPEAAANPQTAMMNKLALYVFPMIEKEDEAKRQEVIQRRASNAPAPGAKPKRNPKAAKASGNGSSTAGDETTDSDDGAETQAAEAKTEQAQPETPGAAGRDDGPSNRTPRPGARPKRRKR